MTKMWLHLATCLRREEMTMIWHTMTYFDFRVYTWQFLINFDFGLSMKVRILYDNALTLKFHKITWLFRTFTWLKIFIMKIFWLQSHFIWLLFNNNIFLWLNLTLKPKIFFQIKNLWLFLTRPDKFWLFMTSEKEILD